MNTTTPDAEAPRTQEVKKEKTLFGRACKMLGPGLITGASDDDPSGIITYAQAGAQFGMQPLWTCLFTFPLMAAVQYICSKIGLVTGRGLAGVMRKHYPRWLLYSSVAILVIANTLNAGADIGAIAAGFHLICPAIHQNIFAFAATLLIVVLLVKGSYNQSSSIFKWLTIALFGYIGSSLLTHPDWAKVAFSTFVPHIEPTKEYISLLVAILGTTISPYLFFWQTECEVEEQHKEGLGLNPGATKDDLKYAAYDVNAGMLFSNLVMFFIILSSAITLHAKGVKEVTSAAQAAEALRPVAGDFAYYLFAIGIIGTGFLAVPVLVGSAAYALATAFGWRRGLDQQWFRAKEFYGVIIIACVIGMLLTYLNINPMSMLFLTAILNGLLAPPLLIVIMLVSNNSEIMGQRTNSPIINILGWTAAAAMSVAAIALIITSLPSGK